VKLGFAEDPPATGATIAKLKRRDQCRTERGGTKSVRHGRARTYDEIATDDLADNLRRERQQIVVSRWSTSRHVMRGS